MSSAGLLALLSFIAVFTEWLTERVFGSIPKLKGWPMVLIASGIGVALCFAFNIDALKLVGLEAQYPHWLGVVITGVVVGSGSNMVHRFFRPSQPTEK